jgi:hypothetical protein
VAAGGTFFLMGLLIPLRLELGGPVSQFVFEQHDHGVLIAGIGEVEFGNRVE